MKSRRRKLVTLIAFSCVPWLLLTVMASATGTISQPIYEVHVQEQSDGSQMGSWNAVTGASHPAGSGRDITYRDTITTTNFSSLRIYRADGSTSDFTPGGIGGGINLDASFDSESTSPANLVGPNGQGLRTVWRIDAEGLRLTQDVIVVGTTMDESAIYHTVEIENLGAETVQIGWRNLHDWSLSGGATGPQDGPSNGLEGACGSSLASQTQTEFSQRPVAAGLVRLSLIGQPADYSPALSLGFDPAFLPALPISVPDEYAYVVWGRAVSTAFDDTTQGAVATDSAGLSWFGRDAATARQIPAGGSIRFTQALFAFEEEECLPEPTCAEVPRGLVGWWPFNEEEQGPGGGAFEDRARGHEGVARFPPAAIAGRVARAARFDGQLDEIVVFDADDLDIGAGVDFSIDFWMRTDDASGLSILLEKRSVSPLRGYQVFLSNGSVGLQLADGGGSQGFRNFVSSANVADGAWHLVAVTVRRNDPDGLVFYVDGQEDSRFNPTNHAGSLVNDADLLIGGRDPAAPSAGAPYRGDLDELEIARRVFLAGEIEDIYQAGHRGKCATSIDVPWDTYVCPNDGSVTVQITTCNHGGSDGSYVFDFESLPPGVPSSLCNVQGPGQFELLGNPPLSIPAGECRNSLVRIQGVAAIPPHLGACYQVTATDVLSGLVEIDYGSVRTDPGLCCSIPVPVTPIRPGSQTAFVTFELEDVAFGESTLDVVVEASQSDDSAPPALQLADAAPGDAVERRVTFGADGIATLEVPVRLTEDFTPGAFYDILLSAQLGADLVPLISASVVAEADPCVPGLNGLCLNGERFRAEARWRTDSGEQGVAQAVPLTTDTGFFWFFHEANLELAVKVLDACTFNDSYWVFVGGLTNVEVDLVVTDLLTGDSKTYANPLGTPFEPILDTSAFATCDAGSRSNLGSGPWLDLEAGYGVGEIESLEKVTRLPLKANRFVVEAEWQTASGDTGEGEGIALTTDTGYFWFFRESNVELAVKILDACGFNGSYWVFVGGLTDVGVRLTVTDTATGESKTYTNPLGTPFQPIQDTRAFATCP